MNASYLCPLSEHQDLDVENNTSLPVLSTFLSPLKYVSTVTPHVQQTYLKTEVVPKLGVLDTGATQQEFWHKPNAVLVENEVELLFPQDKR